MLKNSPYHNKNNKNFSWEEYVNAGFFPVDSNKYLDEKNKLCVNKIIKYESLEKELYLISRKLGFKIDKINARAKSGFREDITTTNQTKQNKKS